MKKRSLSGFLAVAVMLSMLSACGLAENPTPTPDVSAATVQTPVPDPISSTEPAITAEPKICNLTISTNDIPQAEFAKEEIMAAGQKCGVEESWSISLETIDESLGYEAYQVKVGDKTVTITGGDANGLMYGGLEVAEQLALANGMEGISNCQGTPSIENRGIKFNAPLDMRTPSYSDAGDVAQDNIENVWDIEFWKEYFDFLARNRYNSFSLWNLNPFPSMVKVADYPDIALDDVWRTTIPFDDTYNTTASNLVRPEHWENYEVLKKLTIDEKIAFWQEVMAYAHDRGIKFFIYTWNIYTYGENGKYGITSELNNETTRDYYRKSVKAMVETYPDLDGIGVTAGENMDLADEMARPNEQWLYDTYGQGINDALSNNAEREFALLHRLHWANFDMIEEIWANFKGNFDFSDKYSVGHIHSSTTPDFVDENFEKMPAGKKSWLELRNDDMFNLRWGDADYIREYLGGMPDASQLRGFFFGSDGYIFAREYNGKDDVFKGQLYAKKHWYEFGLWGRLGYDLTLTTEHFQQLMAEHFEGAVTEEQSVKLAQSMGYAGKIIPLVTTYFWVSSDLYYPEASASHITSFGYINLKTWANSVNTQSGAGVLSTPEYVDADVKGDPIPAGRTPEETSEQLAEYSEQALKLAEELLADEPESFSSDIQREFYQMVHDQRMMANLGRYYSEKTAAAIQIRYFHDTGDEAYRTSALEHVEKEIEYWKLYANEFESYYEPQLYGRLQWVVYPSELTADVEKEASIVEKWRARPII